MQSKPGLLRTGALIALPLGAVGSVALMLHAGRRNPSLLLMILFTLWVLSPFALLTFLNFPSERWSALTRTTLHSLTLVITLASLAIYGYFALGPPRVKVASAFVILPPASLLLIAIGILTAGRLSRETRT